MSLHTCILTQKEAAGWNQESASDLFKYCGLQDSADMHAMASKPADLRTRP